jgi:hypothetical protein
MKKVVYSDEELAKMGKCPECRSHQRQWRKTRGLEPGGTEHPCDNRWHDVQARV